jgi:hypothetical protein
MAKVWQIRGYDGDNPTFERELPFGSVTDLEMETILQRLQARHLTDDEIVSASLRKNMAGYRHDFEIQQNIGGGLALMTNGSGWLYTARPVEK